MGHFECFGRALWDNFWSAMRRLIEHCERVVVTLWEHIEGIFGTL